MTRITLELDDPKAVASSLHRNGYEAIADQIKAQLPDGEDINGLIEEFAEIVECDIDGWGPHDLRRRLREFAYNVLDACPVVTS